MRVLYIIIWYKEVYKPADDNVNVLWILFLPNASGYWSSELPSLTRQDESDVR
jgi:hypothetical protein